MSGRDFDIAIAGGGLAGGLIAAALARYRPEIRTVLVEAGDSLGGNHRWSWFSSDLSQPGAELLEPFRRTVWDQGYEVRFPTYRRALATPYNSLASTDFDAALRRQLPEQAILTGRQIASLDARGITLANGNRIGARAVIDCRGFAPSPHLRGGWQVFMGRHMRTRHPHGLSRPWIMDATVEQHGAYRFVYVLPIASHELLVEDTYYADSPELDRSALSSRIDAYCAFHGWRGEILGGETGVLPVITGGNFSAWQAAQRVTDVAVAGARGGFTHPLTSYSLPLAVEVALMIAIEADLPGPQLAAMVQARARRYWRKARFYRRLGRMLFGAGPANERWRIFARFYRLPEPLVERFYAGRSTHGDRARILCGRPPVPLLGALAALAGSGGALDVRAAA